MNPLKIAYHTQINNGILPYATCGTTCMAEYLDYLNDHYGKTYKCKDDEVFEILNGPEMVQKAEELVQKGVIDKAALDFRADNPKTDIDEGKYRRLNNFMELLAEVGTFITGREFLFTVHPRTCEDVEKLIDNGVPVLTGGAFTGSGHFVLIVGYDDKNLIVDDPYGDWNEGYAKDTRGKGKQRKYLKVALGTIFRRVSGYTASFFRCITAARV